MHGIAYNLSLHVPLSLALLAASLPEVPLESIKCHLHILAFWNGQGTLLYGIITEVQVRRQGLDQEVILDGDLIHNT